MKRLVAANNDVAIRKLVNSLSDNGRNILKELEKFKYSIVQGMKVTKNMEEVNKKMQQNYDMVDKIMSGLYGVCFSLDNLDIVPLYQEEQINLSEQDQPVYDLNKQMPIKEENTNEQPATKNQTKDNSDNSTDNAEVDESATEENDETIDDDDNGNADV